MGSCNCSFMDPCVNLDTHSSHIRYSSRSERPTPLHSFVDKSRSNQSSFPCSKEATQADFKVPDQISRHSPDRLRNALQSIFQHEGNEAQLIEREMSASEFDLLSEICQKNFLFKELTKVMLKYFIEAMRLHAYTDGQEVFKQGQPGEKFYIISTGQVEVLINRKVTNILERGESFGELALINDSCRSATIRCITDSEIWALDRITFQNTLKSLNRLNYEENTAFIEMNPMFDTLTADQKERLIAALIVHNFPDGATIVKEGDPGDILYIIKEGKVTVEQSRVGSLKCATLRTLGKGDYFGEQALLYYCHRTATVHADGDVVCLSLSRIDLQTIFGDEFQTLLYKNSARIALDKSETYSLMPDHHEKLLENMVITSYYPDQTAIHSMTPMSNGIWIVLKGQLYQNGHMIADTFEIIGDGLFQQSEGVNFPTPVIANGYTAVGFIWGHAMRKHCRGQSWDEVATQNQIIQTLQSIPLFKVLTIEKLEIMAQALEVKNYSQGDTIVKEGDVGSEFFIIKSGSVTILKGLRGVRTMFKNEYFGAKAILLQQNRSATVVADEEDTSCWTLSQEVFNEVMDSNVRHRLLKRMQLQDDSIQLEHLSVIKRLGQGSMCTVYLCVHQQTRVLYALKSISRAKIGKYKFEQNVLNERNLLLRLDHSGIVHLVKTFKDADRVYYLWEYINGIDLWEATREINIFSNEQAQFYIGNLILALEHLAKQSIVHRNLKPENLLVDDEGYIAINDFGAAKIIEERTYTIVGTAYYMAPEVITGKGYSNSCDLWSMGVILYEFVCWELPFGEEWQDPQEIYTAVIFDKLMFPAHSADHPAVPIIKNLLTKQPYRRGNLTSLKKHEWFKDMNWEDLYYRALQPSYTPLLEPIDLSNPLIGPVQTIIYNDEALDPIRGVKKYSNDWDENF